MKRYNILQLMKLTTLELQALADFYPVNPDEKIKRQTLIYSILNKQATTKNQPV